MCRINGAVQIEGRGGSRRGGCRSSGWSSRHSRDTSRHSGNGSRHPGNAGRYLRNIRGDVGGNLRYVRYATCE